MSLNKDLACLITKMMRWKWFWIVAFSFFVLVLFGLSFNSRTLDLVNFGYKTGSGYGGSWLTFCVRFISLLSSLMICVCILVVSRLFYNRLKNNKLASAAAGGGGTLFAYLTHWFLMDPLVWLFNHCSTPIAFTLCFISSLILTWALSRQQIVSIFSPLMDLEALKQIFRSK